MQARALVIVLAIAVSGCSTGQVQPSATQVELNKNNFRVVKANARGASTGFRLLGILPLWSPSYINAMSDLKEKGYGPRPGAYAIKDIVQERSTVYLILFSLPRIRVSADVIEFIDDPRPRNP